MSVNKLSVFKKYRKNPWVIGVLLLVIVTFFYLQRSGRKVEAEIVAVKSGAIQEGVSVTGKVKAAQAVDLAFEKSGKISKANKQVGDRVRAGEIIVQIDNSGLYASLAQAKAGLRFQQSKLAELKAGTRPEQLDITRAKTVSAKTDLGVARVSLVAALENAYTLVDDAIRNKVDNFFINPGSTNTQLAFGPIVVSQTSLESGRVEVENRLRAMKNSLSAVSTTSDLTSTINEVKRDLGEIKLFLDNISLEVNALSAKTNYVSQSSIISWKADLSAARTSVNTAITTLLTAEDKVNASQSAYDLANRALTLDLSGSVIQEIEAEQAQVDQALANVASVYADLSKTYLKTPIAGVITKQDAKAGETVFANTTTVSVMTDATFEIEANIPEADIAKVKAGQEAKVTLDAYSADIIFSAKVVSVDPAETVVDGVPTYKTTFQFENADERIRSGMTANIDIQGEMRENVLLIPQRAIASRNGKKYVLLQTGKNTSREVAVKTGLRGFDGSMEILDGLSLGDAVIIRQK